MDFPRATEVSDQLAELAKANPSLAAQIDMISQSLRKYEHDMRGIVNRQVLKVAVLERQLERARTEAVA